MGMAPFGRNALCQHVHRILSTTMEHCYWRSCTNNICWRSSTLLGLLSGQRRSYFDCKRTRGSRCIVCSSLLLRPVRLKNHSDEKVFKVWRHIWEDKSCSLKVRQKLRGDIRSNFIEREHAGCVVIAEPTCFIYLVDWHTGDSVYIITPLDVSHRVSSRIARRRSENRSLTHSQRRPPQPSSHSTWSPLCMPTTTLIHLTR